MFSPSISFPTNRDDGIRSLSRMAAAVSAGLIGLVLLFLVRESLPAFERIGFLRFLSDESWHPLSNRFYLLPMILGTALTSAGALFLAAPLGLASALYGRFYAPARLAIWHRRLVELLAGIPSVVFGLWGLVVLVPLLAPLGGSGQSLLAATLVLALMILPTIALTSQAALASVEPELLSGGAALGLSRAAIALRIAVPAARPGIRSGLFLAASRAMGETMAVLMLAGNVAEIPESLVSPVRTLTANIALEMGYAASAHRAILFVSGLVLLLCVGVLVLGLDRFTRSSPRAEAKANG